MAASRWRSRAAAGAAKAAGGRAIETYTTRVSTDGVDPDGPTAELVGRVARRLIMLARRPGQVLVGLASVPVAFFVFFATIVGATSTTWVGWIPFGLSVLLAVPVAVLAHRRRRLERSVDEVEEILVVSVDPASGSEAPSAPETGREHGVGTGAGPDAPASPAAGEPAPDGAPRTGGWGADARTISASAVRGAVKPTLFLPRVAAVQHILLQAAGGPVRAPYLRDDLRVTVLAFAGTIAAIPLGGLGAVVSIILLLV